MAKVTVYNLERKAVGELDLADSVFGRPVNEGLLYDVVKAQLASKRVGSANTKVRAEVSGTSKKVYKQKGTGNARHGSKRAPTYVGGGQAHGPKPRDYSYRPTRKMRIGALCSALSLKLQEGALTVVDGFDLGDIKTKNVLRALTSLQAPKGALIVDGVDNEKLRLSTRNLENSQFLPPEGVNTYDLLRYPHLILTKRAVAALEARCTQPSA